LSSIIALMCNIYRGKIKTEGPVQAMKATGRSVALIPHIATSALVEVSCQFHATASLSGEKIPVQMGDWMGSRVDWMPRRKTNLL